jgi:hypothetical protein
MSSKLTARYDLAGDSQKEIEMKLTVSTGLIAALAASVFSAAIAIADPIQPTTRPAGDASITASQNHWLLRTEDFESGKIQLSDTTTTQLEDLLRDLNRRKDFDFASHDGSAGPNADYLANWVTKVTNELTTRGYWFSADGDLHAPDGTIVLAR